MKKLLTILILFFPLVCTADYDQEKIRHTIDENKSIFGVIGWRLTENGGAYLADTATPNMVLSVGPYDAGMMLAVDDVDNSFAAIFSCIKLAEIGLQTQDKQINQRVFAAFSSGESHAIAHNNVVFSVEQEQIGSATFVSCQLKDQKQRGF
ncbi:hypothetical protein [Methylophaga nitratireducenticrescens]|uniref:hypothetical protein n=1 Tax=Methylophaga nitratireducenticrescens TaxID=754476 RepID=UPI000CDC01EA|nr:hypothetical protein [Methylophaga nitratireducenticrescens]AUZ85800.1 hypothetical protein CDW43_15055 [Methylophaga nitratireducenticrescens]AUZ85868.1 hypothetical protein CDW43_15410 [Methylophaga nitratireducenticrescens]